MINKLFAKRLFDGQQYLSGVSITIENGYISELIANDRAEVGSHIIEDLIVPGFIDLQVNGGGGVLLNTNPTIEGLRKMLAAHRQFGTTAMLPTVISDCIDVMEQAANAVAEAIATNEPGIAGIHFEGPHLAEAKKGAHSPHFFREITEREWQLFSRRDIGQVLVTIAPETVSVEQIERFVALGVKVSLGHSNASFEQAQQAFLAGSDGVTHLYNAMSPFTSREPGLVGAALLNDNIYCGLIADGHHVDFHSCQLALKAKPQGKVFLVTDAMSTVGTQTTSFDFFDRKVYLNNGKLTSTTGELAGSALDMNTAVRNVTEFMNRPLEEALRMAALYPADYISDFTRGRIGVGSRADFVQLDKNINVISTWISGEQMKH